MRNELFEQLQSLAFQIKVLRGKPGDISVRTRQIRDDADAHRIANGPHHDGNRSGRLLGCERRRSAHGDDQVDWERGQFRSHGGVAVVTTFRKARYKAQILTFVVTILAQLACKPLERW